MPKGKVLTVAFELEGQEFLALNGGANFHFTPAISIIVNCDHDGDWMTIREGDRKPGQHIRPAGFDFKTGDALLQPGRRLTARDIALAAAMNRPWLNVSRKPRVALLSTGNELINPGDAVGPASSGLWRGRT